MNERYVYTFITLKFRLEHNLGLVAHWNILVQVLLLAYAEYLQGRTSYDEAAIGMDFFGHLNLDSLAAQDSNVSY